MDQSPEKKPNTEKSSDETIIEPLRTYQQDIRNVVANQNISVVKMALAESQKQNNEDSIGDVTPPASKKNILLLSISIVLVIVALCAIGGTYYFLSSTKTPPVTQNSGAFIATDSTHTITLTGTTKQELSQKIEAEENSLPNGLVEGIIFHVQGTPATNTLSINDFLTTIQSKAPDALVRSLSPQFAFGFYGKNRVPYIIIETNSYDQAYAGMLQWEPSMRSELENILFSTDFENQLPVSTSTVAAAVTTTTSTAAIATSTTKSSSTKSATSTNATTTNTTSTTTITTTPTEPGDSAVAFQTSFKDLVVSNKDTRALYNRAGQLLVLYGFVDKQYIVITRDPDTLNEIFNRLRENELSR